MISYVSALAYQHKSYTTLLAFYQAIEVSRFKDMTR